MDTAVKPVQNGRGRRRQWRSAQKLTVLQEWQTGIPLEEICRTYAMNAAQMYRWKCSLDQGLKEPGELVPKSHVLLGERLNESALMPDPCYWGLNGIDLPRIRTGSHTESESCNSALQAQPTAPVKQNYECINV